jgi:xanthine dehydrogenase iron-sulfur cluster and FAD-binding subunit A
VRNTATIGGNICRASPSGETLTPLLVWKPNALTTYSDGKRRQESFPNSRVVYSPQGETSGQAFDTSATGLA